MEKPYRPALSKAIAKLTDNQQIEYRRDFFALEEVERSLLLGHCLWAINELAEYVEKCHPRKYDDGQYRRLIVSMHQLNDGGLIDATLFARAILQNLKNSTLAGAQSAKSSGGSRLTH